MKYLQVMPTDQPIMSGFDLGLVLTVSLVLVGVIFLFDKSKATTSWRTRNKR